MPRGKSRGDRAVRWIQDYCLVPSGPDKGLRVRLTPVQQDTVRQIYDNPNGPQDVPVTGPLAAYLALLHVCGPEAVKGDFRPAVNADIFTTWNAVGPRLREVLTRDGERLVCPQLGTGYPAAA
jgi:hypothetical protein